MSSGIIRGYLGSLHNPATGNPVLNISQPTRHCWKMTLSENGGYLSIPIGSMYGIYANMTGVYWWQMLPWSWHTYGSYGICNSTIWDIHLSWEDGEKQWVMSWSEMGETGDRPSNLSVFPKELLDKPNSVQICLSVDMGWESKPPGASMFAYFRIITTDPNPSYHVFIDVHSLMAEIVHVVVHSAIKLCCPRKKKACLTNPERA